MGSLIVVLIAVAVCCSETSCDTLPPTTIVEPEDASTLTEVNANRAIDNGFLLRNLDPRKPTKIDELKNPDSTSSAASKRKARLLGSLAFLAGLSFGGLASAASSSVKTTLAKMPQASLTLNLGPSKTSPYFAAYYSPYSLIPYPFLYPFGLLPSADPSKISQVSSHNDVAPQVISVFDNRQPDNFAENIEEYADQEKNLEKSAVDGEDGAEHRPELRAEADRNAEEKVLIHGCKETQRKHGNSFKGSPKEREDLQVDADDSAAALKQTNMFADTNQTVIRDRTTTRKPSYLTFKEPTKRPPGKPDNSTTTNNNTSTERPGFPGYYEGYPQDISHVDLTTGSDAYHYQDHPGQINYHLPYERPTNFYRDDVYSNHHVNPYFPGSFSPDQVNGYVGTDFGRVYPSEYQPPYANGFKPVK